MSRENTNISDLCGIKKKVILNRLLDFKAQSGIIFVCSLLSSKRGQIWERRLLSTVSHILKKY